MHQIKVYIKIHFQPLHLVLPLEVLKTLPIEVFFSTNETQNLKKNSQNNNLSANSNQSNTSTVISYFQIVKHDNQEF